MALNLVNETERLTNLTLTVVDQFTVDYFEAVFYLFDIALLATKIVS